ncbi:hypothetical protein [Candidatus Poriferisodalis sp.]|uniref:hypothetical protein n=1 Tax=Candidatus Poriferisodalis sp. TaxID=3101277 RepID=UPI003D107B1D
MGGVDPLFVIYRSRADRLVAELWAVHLGAGAILGVLVAVLSPLDWWSMPLALALAGAVALWGHRAGEKRLATALCPEDSTMLGSAGAPRLANIVDGLCLLVGVEAPSLVVSESPAANIAAVGRRSDQSTLVVTRGLLDSLNLIELEAAVARVLTQIRDGRTAYMTTAVTTVGLPALWSVGLRGIVRSRLEREASTGSDFDADAEAVRLTRYPPGLANALESMSGVGVGVDAPAVTWPLWLADPRAATSAAPDALPDCRADLEARVAVLREF